MFQPGWYYILVKGYNGAHSRHPYTLNVTISPPTDVRSCNVVLPPPSGVIIARWMASTTPETLILVNQQRMDAYYGVGSALSEQLLQTFASHYRMDGLIEPLENIPPIADAYDTWDHDACNPQAANGVAEAIKQHIDDLRELYPSIQQVLIIGNDDIIPFYRVPDEVNAGNESAYASEIDADQNSPFYSALEQGYVLTTTSTWTMIPWRGAVVGSSCPTAPSAGWWRHPTRSPTPSSPTWTWTARCRWKPASSSATISLPATPSTSPMHCEAPASPSTV
jgi:hypothetical protein